MAIKQLPQSQGILGSKAASVGLGFLTGGPLGAGAALAASNNPAIARALSVAGMAGGLKSATQSATPIADTLRQPELGESFRSPAPEAPLPTSPDDLRKPEIGDSFKKDQSAIGRRLSVIGADPQAAIHDGLSALRDPSVPAYVRQAYAEPLLMAKHFGGRRMG